MLWIILGISVISIILYDGYKTKRIKYALKRSANSVWEFVVIVWVFYFFLGSVNLIPPITKWLNSPHDWSQSTITVMSFLPYAFVITVIYIAIKVVFSNSQVIKYDEQEQGWERERQIKFRDKLPSYLRRFVKIKDAPKIV